jgi:hypothetical protein
VKRDVISTPNQWDVTYVAATDGGGHMPPSPTPCNIQAIGSIHTGEVTASSITSAARESTPELLPWLVLAYTAGEV